MQGTVLIQVLTLAAVVLAQQAPQPEFFGGAQYHIQTDQGAERFFRFQTASGQYRKEVRHEDGSQEGTYGWVDPNNVLRLYDYIADSLGYRIVQESLYKVGPSSPASALETRGGVLHLGFEVYPLDGAVPAGRLGPSLPATQLHVGDADFRATPGYTVPALLSSLPHEVHPNPLAKQIGATLFTAAAPPPPPRVVVGAVALPRQPEQEAFVVGHTRQEAPVPRAPARRTGIVIGLSHNDDLVSRAAPVPRALRPRPEPAAERRDVIVIGSSRRKRLLLPQDQAM